jgi:VanZ family protein
MIGERERMRLVRAMQALVLLFVLYSCMRPNLPYACAGAFLLALMMIPYGVEILTDTVLSSKIHLLIGFAIYFHGFGALMGLYQVYYPFFDKIAHLFSATAITLLGLVIVLLLNRTATALPGIPLTLIVIVMGTMGLGAIWEITEYLCDQCWETGFQMGLADTMLDLLFDLAGSLLGGAWVLVRLTTTPRDRIVEAYIRTRTRDGLVAPPARGSR